MVSGARRVNQLVQFLLRHAAFAKTLLRGCIQLVEGLRPCLLQEGDAVFNELFGVIGGCYAGRFGMASERA